MKRVAVFDFDGTITSNDTLIEFLKFTFGWVFYIKIFLLIPILISFKAGLLNNDKAKQMVFSFFFKGWSIDSFNFNCNNFKTTINTRPLAMERIKHHIKNKDEVVIISASIENWVKPWAIDNGIVHVLATQIEVVNQKITGRFSSKNCYGVEKTNRLLKLYTNREDYYLIVYGDSLGDKELISYADEGYFRIF